MKEVEKITVYCDIVKGKTMCICAARNKGCKKKCERCTVTRDLFDGWQETMQRDKYGQCKD